MYSTHNEGKSVVAERFIRALNNIRGENLCQLYNTLHYQLDMKGTRFLVFFLSGFSFTETDDSQDSREREGNIVYFALPLPPAHKHSGIYLQLYMWDDYHVYLIAALVFIRLLLDEIYHLIGLPFDWLIYDANWLTKCAIFTNVKIFLLVCSVFIIQ